MQQTCIKKYIDIPFAHRQPVHRGHCAMIHGHNWAFEFEFTAPKNDECDFVVDFGGLKELKRWIDEQFDHSLVLNEDDPQLDILHHALCTQAQALCGRTFAKITVVPSCSSEGIARYLFNYVKTYINTLTGGRAELIRVTVYEDHKNSATYRQN